MLGISKTLNRTLLNRNLNKSQTGRQLSCFQGWLAYPTLFDLHSSKYPTTNFYTTHAKNVDYKNKNKDNKVAERVLAHFNNLFLPFFKLDEEETRCYLL